jgi:hypothetical protein
MIAQRPIDQLEPPVRPTGVSGFERFFRRAAGRAVDKQDLKRYSDFVNHKIYDLLACGQESARTNGRDRLKPIDLPIRAEFANNLTVVMAGARDAPRLSLHVATPRRGVPGAKGPMTSPLRQLCCRYFVGGRHEIGQ